MDRKQREYRAREQDELAQKAKALASFGKVPY